MAARPFSVAPFFAVPDQNQDPEDEIVQRIAQIPVPASTDAVERPAFTIASADLRDESLWVATSKGNLLKYTLSQSMWHLAKRVSVLRNKARVSTTPRIMILKAVNKVLYFGDSTITFYDASALTECADIAPIRGVLNVCLDEYPSKQAPRANMSLERICVAKRRLLQSFEIWGNASPDKDQDIQVRMTLERQVAVQSTIHAIARAGDHICIAESSGFRIFNCATGNSTKLAAVGPSDYDPLVGVCDSQRFYLVTCEGRGQPALGIFVNTSGDPIWGTIFWPRYPAGVSVQFPYILGMLADSRRQSVVHVHNLFSQDLVQTIQMADNHCGLGSIRSFTTIHSATRIDRLVMAELDTQVDELISSGRLDEAVLLAERMKKDVRSVHVKAGLAYLMETLFEDAFALFRKARLDPRYILHLYLPSVFGKDDIEPSCQPIANVPDIEELIERNASKLAKDSAYRAALKKNLTDTLLDYVSWGIRENVGDRYVNVKATVMLKAEKGLQYPILSSLSVVKAPALVSEVEGWMLDNKYYHTLLGLYEELNNGRRKLDILRKMMSEGQSSAADSVVKILLQTDDEGIVWEHLEGLFDADKDLAMRLVFSRKDFNQEKVVDFLGAKDQGSLFEYLEYLVVEQERLDFAQKLVDLLKRDVAGRPDMAVRAVTRYRRDYLNNTSMINYIFQFTQANVDRDETNQESVFEESELYYYLCTRRKILALITFCGVDVDGHDGDIPDGESRFDSCAQFPETGGCAAAPRLETKLDELQECWSRMRNTSNPRQEFITLLDTVQDYRSAEDACTLYSFDVLSSDAAPEICRCRIEGLRKVYFNNIPKALKFEGMMKNQGFETNRERRKGIFEEYERFLMENTARYSMALINHINHNVSSDRIMELLAALPDQWSMSLFSQALQRTQRHLLHEGRLAAISKSLSRTSHLDLSQHLMNVQRRYPPIYITQQPAVTCYCDVCKRPVLNNHFRWLPGHRVVHLSCGR